MDKSEEMTDVENPESGFIAHARVNECSIQGISISVKIPWISLSLGFLIWSIINYLLVRFG